MSAPFNQDPAYDVDLFVIGAGSGGVRAANRAAQAGARVAIAEQDRVGGTCVLRGCVPKKLMVYAANFKDQIADAAGYGWAVTADDYDWPTFRDRIQTELTRLNGLYIKGLSANGVPIHDTRAVLKDANTVHLVDQKRDVTAAKILVATGGTPVRDPMADPDALGLVSDDVFHLDQIPKRLVVAGGGYIAIEFAHVFARLGSEVTLVYRGERLLKAFDQDISTRVERDLKAAGIRYLPNTVFTSISGEKGGEKTIALISGETLTCDEVLWAIGRRPLTDSMGLERCGVALGPNGKVLVNGQQQTNVPSIFALGDVTDCVALTPVAIREGMAFVSTQFKGTAQHMDYDAIPSAVFSQPPVATVGPTEAECAAAGIDFTVYEADFRPMRNVLAGNDERIYMKMIVKTDDQRVLACHMVGVDTPEMIQMVGIAVKAGLTKAQFDATCAVHPTAAEELVTMATPRA